MFEGWILFMFYRELVVSILSPAGDWFIFNHTPKHANAAYQAQTRKCSISSLFKHIKHMPSQDTRNSQLIGVRIYIPDWRCCCIYILMSLVLLYALTFLFSPFLSPNVPPAVSTPHFLQTHTHVLACWLLCPDALSIPPPSHLFPRNLTLLLLPWLFDAPSLTLFDAPSLTLFGSFSHSLALSLSRVCLCSLYVYADVCGCLAYFGHLR